MDDVINKILQGNALNILKTLPDKSINCCVTSPPYWNLRDYGVDGQLGLELTPEEYVSKMVEVFREVKRVLRDDGILWLNLGDSYTSGKPRDCDKGGLRYNNSQSKQAPPGYKPKDLVGIPWMIAFALRADGWYLRSDIIWHKPNPMPESVTDRPTKAHEYLFLLSKSRKYYYDYEAIKEPAKEWSGQAATFARDGAVGRHIIPGQSYAQHRPNRSGNKERKLGTARGRPNSHLGGSVSWEGNTRNKRSVWTVPTRPFPEAHFATFPPKLIEPCILAGCPEGGIVLDPFMGAGTTALVATELSRNYIGIELNPKYIKIAEKRLSAVQIRLSMV